MDYWYVFYVITNNYDTKKKNCSNIIKIIPIIIIIIILLL